MSKKKAKEKKSKKAGKQQKTPNQPNEEELLKRERDAKNALYKNTYKLIDNIRFKPYEFEDEVTDVLRQRLTDKNYLPSKAEEDCQLISRLTSEIINKKTFKHFKHVVLVSIGSVKERPGIYLCTKCLWNDKTDSSTIIRFQNSSIYAVVLIYGLYYE